MRKQEINYDSVIHSDHLPAWIPSLTLGQAEDIWNHGCASGAYMPAVTYHVAAKTMAEHGDEVLESLKEYYNTLPTPPLDTLWSGMSCFYLSAAVEVHCAYLMQLHEDGELTFKDDDGPI